MIKKISILTVVTLGLAFALYWANDVAMSASLRTGLVGYWTMDSNDINGTTVYDKSGQGNNGTGTNITSADLVAGKINQSIDFNGGEYINTVDNPFDFGTGNFTATAWIKLNSQAAINPILDKYGASPGWILWANTAGGNQLLGYIGSGSADMTGATALSVGKWYHAAMVRNGDNAYLYLNGIQDATVSGMSARNVNSEVVLGIGSESNGAQSMNGAIDDARVYNRALSASEISYLYNSNKRNYVQAPPRNGLVGYWTMDSGDISGTNVWDKSGQRNNQTLVGTPTIGSGKIAQSVSLNGSSQYSWILNPTFINDTQGTMSAWVKINDLATTQSLMIASVNGATDDEYRIDYVPTDKQIWIYMIINGAASFYANTAANTITDNNWHLITFTSNGSAVSAYVDGINKSLTVTVGSNSGQWFASATDADMLSVGVLKRATPIQYLNGKIDDVRIYNRVLSAAEVANLYKSSARKHVSAPPRGGLVGYWTMDSNDVSGVNWYDKSGNNLTATSTASPTNVAGKIKEGINFNGSSQYLAVNSASSLDVASAHTLSAWVKPTALGLGLLFSKRNTANNWPYQLYTLASGNLDYYSDGGSTVHLISGQPLEAGKWQHVALTRDGTSVTFYKDGVATTTRTLAAGSASASAPLNFGAGFSPTLGNYYNGAMDDMRIYNRALSASEVKQLYDSSRQQLAL